MPSIYSLSCDSLVSSLVCRQKEIVELGQRIIFPSENAIPGHPALLCCPSEGKPCTVCYIPLGRTVLLVATWGTISLALSILPNLLQCLETRLQSEAYYHSDSSSKYQRDSSSRASL